MKSIHSQSRIISSPFTADRNQTDGPSGLMEPSFYLLCANKITSNYRFKSARLIIMVACFTGYWISDDHSYQPSTGYSVVAQHKRINCMYMSQHDKLTYSKVTLEPFLAES